VFEAADIREWRGHEVTDAQGNKVGEQELPAGYEEAVFEHYGLAYQPGGGGGGGGGGRPPPPPPPPG
jgi:hypothetical protein